ncbi:class I SAM-dependent methyltransferase [Mangrovihabitans endophyticus]|uniref:S-adenosyl-L-methionine-dependent methyltransferase n=1 Tax=Mangrovihabitans endophyticus TaxID=1751298 RepID=A0A8J3BWG2_9ACTN|nr:class I SAM-dependent methyltransferase [Mangrovihabitans endophyticus]GGK74243.1 S-adenosyl-L-methionine-dependent methyltransferase [Mangrovihabitans endophyticus]
MTATADKTAIRTALWRALHVQADPRPHVFEDDLGARLVAPDGGWRSRPDMDLARSAGARASIVARARFIEDLVVERAGEGIGQYVILGAGLDTFAQRRPPGAAGMRVFEVDQPETQAWKRARLAELGYRVPEELRLVPVDFEADDDWWQRLVQEGFDPARPAVLACSGVTMYLTRDAVAATLRTAAALAERSVLVMTFMQPVDLVDPAERAAREGLERAARADGTPFRSFFGPHDILALAKEAGFRHVEHVSAADLAERYFAGRADGLRPSTIEELLLATV